MVISNLQINTTLTGGSWVDEADVCWSLNNLRAYFPKQSTEVVDKERF